MTDGLQTKDRTLSSNCTGVRNFPVVDRVDGNDRIVLSLLRNFDFETGSTRHADTPGTSPQLIGPHGVFMEHGPAVIVAGS
jgi:hypothetical protein